MLFRISFNTILHDAFFFLAFFCLSRFTSVALISSPCVMITHLFMNPDCSSALPNP